MSTQTLSPHTGLVLPGPPPWVVYMLFASVLYLAYSYLSSTPRLKGLPLPPGPAPWPIIGNLLDVPNRDLGANYAKISEKYGNIARLSVFGSSIIVLGSYEAACSLLERRSGTTSDRQAPIMAHMTGFGSWEFATFGYGQAWRSHRRAFHEHFHRGEAAQYRALQRQQTRVFLRRLLAKPQGFVSHIRYLFGATILQAVYGITVEEENDHFIALVERGVDIFVKVMSPGRYLVDSIPALRHVPAWLPGAHFKRLAAEWKRQADAVRDEPFHAAVEQMEDGTPKPYVVAKILEKSARKDGVASPEATELARNVAAIAYIGGADTTFSSLQAFFLAMALYPNVQQKAQAELAAVVGPSRLPEFSDRAQLPYTSAIVTEVLRWLSIAPLSVPHSTTQDEELDGYLIPKGSVILPNVWAMSRDPEAYPEPEEFRPERFLRDGVHDPTVRDPRKYAFGFGRRACPGVHFADNSLFIVIASVLHTFNVAPMVDGRGKPVSLEAKWTTELFVVYPAPFECQITPRSELAKELILSGEE
ncbi:cytochrome P450 [Daedaleopsis nitida]|nr:cytochrome P450 [Daedaleopsis nitida]